MDAKTGPAREAPSALAAGYEAARLAAHLFGEESAGSYVVAGRLLRIDHLPVGDLGLLTVGFRITGRRKEKWTRRRTSPGSRSPTTPRRPAPGTSAVRA